MTEVDIKNQVRQFYDQVGWKVISEGVFQNARYEDLRSVSQEYIHRCHLRVMRHLKPAGKYFLDAGSGPIQYPEYLEYSNGYKFRVCVDISIVALQAARKRIGQHGLFVVADIANLPFRADIFDSVVSLHTIHHLQKDEHSQAYNEIYRVLGPCRNGVVVDGWEDSPIARYTSNPIYWINRIRGFVRRLIGNYSKKERITHKPIQNSSQPKGTYVHKYNATWIIETLSNHVPITILVWRSVNVKFLRAFIHSNWGGRLFLRILFWIEERAPHFFGVNGQYPLIVIQKS